jgi:RNA polymerase sigma factor (sigma-70 family)
LKCNFVILSNEKTAALIQNEHDIHLWEQLRNGNKAALAELFERYFTQLYNYGRKICSDEEQVKDCIQDLFLEIWNQNNKMSLLSVRAYLTKALQYKLIRIKKKSQLIQTFDGNGEEFFELSHETFVIQNEIDTEKVKQLLTSMQQLPKRQQEIIYLKYFLNLSYEEICSVMNIQYQVARNQISSAIKSLKNRADT